jgi:hypothetical protein
VPQSFWIGLIVVAVMVGAWVAAFLYLRVRRTRSDGSAGAPATSERADLREATERDGFAIGMAVSRSSERRNRRRR